MTLKSVVGLFAAVLLVAACESTPEGTASTTGTGGDTSTASTPSSGDFTNMLQQYGERVFFDFDKSELKPAGRSTVEGWAAWLQANPGTNILIDGNADERGTREYNLALGERRANAVQNYLAALGVSPSRVQTISYGKERPIDPGNTEAAYAKNRNAGVSQR